MMIDNATEMTKPQTPSQNNTYASAAMAYGSRQEANMSGFEVTAELYKGMIRFVGQAKNSYEAGRLDDMCMYIQKVNKILMALQSALNFEEGGDSAVFLNNFYNEIFKKLFLVLRTEDPAASFDEVHELLRPAAQLWESHAENARNGMAETHVAMPDMQEK